MPAVSAERDSASAPGPRAATRTLPAARIPGGRYTLISCASIGALLGLWYIATNGAGWIGPLELPGIVDVGQRLRTLSDTPFLGHTVWGHAEASMRVVIVGWLVAGLIGAPSGVLMAWSPRFRSLTYPVFQLLRPVSPIAWIPLTIAWLGIGEQARIFIVFIAAVVPWVINSMEAVTSVDPLLVRAARNLGSGPVTTLWRIVLPAGLPTLLGGARVALGNAWTAVIAAELLAATSGLGYVALNASKALDTTTTVAAMAVIGAIGLALSLVMRQLVRLTAPWARGV